MKTWDEVSAEKLRGGFYTPRPLVRFCLDRVDELTRGRSALKLLEPSAGDGAFVRGLSETRLCARIESVTAVEIVPSEVEKCRVAMLDAGLAGQVYEGSTLEWALEARAHFDVAVGNPPFVRYQFIGPSERRLITQLERNIGVPVAGVSNLWIPVLLGALNSLKCGGAFAFVVPAECFTGISAGAVRRWMVESIDSLGFDLFPPGSFPSVLQEVVVVSGTKAPQSHLAFGHCRITEHAPAGMSRSWVHGIDASPSGGQTWTRYLLSPAQLDALDEASALPCVEPLRSIAKFEVAAVTGANDFFSVDDDTMERYELAPWCRPLLARVRHAPGLRYTPEDHRTAIESGRKAYLLDFSESLPDPLLPPLPSSYLGQGVRTGLPYRYKCEIRNPWFRIPSIRPGRLMLSKRSHRYPRVLLNEADAVTTDTIYRGRALPGCTAQDVDIVAAFHNSFTLLTAEVEGRSFGGGVLEVVPTEIGRLLLPKCHGFGVHLESLDGLARSLGDAESNDQLVEETDRLLHKTNLGFTASLLDRLSDARLALLRRRLDRNTQLKN